MGRGPAFRGGTEFGAPSGLQVSVVKGRAEEVHRRSMWVGGGWRPRATSPTTICWASDALRVMKSLEGGSAGAPENITTHRSKDPHHALTDVDRPQYGARNSARASAAWVAAAK